MYGGKSISIGIFFLLAVVSAIGCVSNAYARELSIDPGGGYALLSAPIVLKSGETGTISVSIPGGNQTPVVRQETNLTWVSASVGNVNYPVITITIVAPETDTDTEEQAVFSIGSGHGTEWAKITINITVMNSIDSVCRDAEAWVLSLFAVDILGCFPACNNNCTVEITERPDWLVPKFGGTILQGTPRDSDVGSHGVQVRAARDDGGINDGGIKGRGSFTVTVKKAECGNTYQDEPCKVGEEVAGSYTACSDTNDTETWQCASDVNSSTGLITCTADCPEDGECGTGGRDASGTVINKCSAGTPKTISTLNNPNLACYCTNVGGGIYKPGEIWKCLGENGGEDSPTCPTVEEYCSVGDGPFPGKCGSCQCICASPASSTAATYQCAGYGGGSPATCSKTGCQGIGGGDDPINIQFDIQTDPSDVGEEGIKDSSKKVRSITFTAKDGNNNNPLWKYWYLSRDPESGRMVSPCNNTIIWDSGTYGNSVVLDEEGDKSVYPCFGAKKGEEYKYKGKTYYASIDTSTYNSDITFSAAGAPNATISGIAEPGARVEIVAATKNRVPIPVGGIFTTADITTGVWDIVINNAIYPNKDTDLAIVTKTTDNLGNFETETHKKTIKKGDRDIEEPITTPGDDTAGGGGGCNNPRGCSNPNAPTAPRTPPSFTIRAEPPRITEGESITWTVTKKNNSAGQHATISCAEEGVWGISWTTKRLSIPNTGGTKSFPMETDDDDTAEKEGLITCVVSSGITTTPDKFSVRIRSNDVVEESKLIIDCTFSNEEDAEGNPENQCGIKHLFQLANNIMKLLLWLAVTGAGILIFYKGAKLAIHLTQGGQQKVRGEVQNALKAVAFGLIFILSAYLIVKAGFDIIGYNLNDGDPFKWDESALPTPEVPEPAKASPPRNPNTPTDPNTPGDTDPQQPTTPQSPLQNCPGCQTKTTSITGVDFKPNRSMCTNRNNQDTTKFGKNNPGVNPTSDCWVSAGLGIKLQELAQQSSAKWRVTEACPPTITHQNNCHKPTNCTCVDANFTSTTANAENIVAFIVAAKNSGLKAVYEVKSRSRYNDLKGSGTQTGPVVSGLIAAGFSKSEAERRIEHISSISADHFSLYSQ